ncbi:unnamed protein product [Cylicostephanus goldi]|uniref:ethanolamine-phosphate cytidylyltransferase n=1 Tax=Cylicostephanus goldi TaxID=71465 RepID=A0A3P6RB90_CYLGO|nr:unnamed protein product [Cylicostephanus goldi]
MATTQTIIEFAEGRAPRPTDKIVYVCGAFDMFHIGHLSFLEEAAKLGDYLIVGILNDQPVNEVVIGAPYCVTDDIIDRFNISIVCQGSRVPHHDRSGNDPFEAPKRRGIYREVDSGSDMTTEKIIERIIEHRYEHHLFPQRSFLHGSRYMSP